MVIGVSIDIFLVLLFFFYDFFLCGHWTTDHRVVQLVGSSPLGDVLTAVVATSLRHLGSLGENFLVNNRGMYDSF